MLEIPHLGNVPRSYALATPPDPTMVRCALALLDRGHIDDKHAHGYQPAEVVKAGLRHWLDGNTRGLKFFDFSLCCSGDAHPGDHLPTQTKNNSITVEIRHRDHIRTFSIGRRLCKLPQALAETALFWIEEAARATLPIYTPADALGYASYTYWQGEDDERDVLAEIAADGGKPVDYELLTRKQFDQAIPAWAAAPEKRVTMESIKALAASRRGGPDVQLGRAIFTLIGALAEYRQRIDFGLDAREEPFLFPQPLGLFWGGMRGIMPRIFDDFAEDVSNSSEYRQHFAYRTIPDGPHFARELNAFLRGVEPAFPILRTLETLLTLVIDKDHGK